MLQASLLLILIGAANTAPLLAKKMLGDRLNVPLDFNTRWLDGTPLFGKSKTVRGVVVGMLVPALLAPLVGHPIHQGAVIGAVAMAGDLFSSFCKRRMQLAPSSQALGLDQIPEVLLPALAARVWFELTLLEIALVVMVFFGLELVLSKLLYRFNLRDKPY